MIMIIEHRHELVTHVAMRPERRRSNIEAVEVAARIRQSLSQIAERQPTTADVERRVQVSTDRTQVATGEVVIGDLTNQEEIPFYPSWLRTP
jgi:hypothetical protein